MSDNNPILNNPYEEPLRHYATDPDGNLNYADIRKGRRVFMPEMLSIPARQGPQQSIFEVNDLSPQWEQEPVNLVRKEVGAWRNTQWPNTTRVTRELLTFWFANTDRHYDKQLFFAQREAVESAIWLNEIAAKSNAGQHILNKLKDAQSITDNPNSRLQKYRLTGKGARTAQGGNILK